MAILTPLLSSTSTSTSTSSETDDSPTNSHRSVPYNIPKHGYRSLAVLSGHVGSVSSLALCGEFILSASQGKDIIVWQQPDLRMFSRFGQGEGSVKALVTVGNKVFTAHQDSRIRVWKVSRSSENVFRLVDSLPTTKDYLGKFMKQSNYVQTRRHHRHLWIEHADSISCLASQGGLIYSGSWDKTLKVWRISDLKCLESIQAHDDAINSVVATKNAVYTASADGKIKAWRKNGSKPHTLRQTLGGNKDVSINTVLATDDGRVVYGGGSDGNITGWSGNEGLDRWGKICEVRAHKMAVLCMCFVGDSFLCSGSADKSIGIWKRDIGGRLSGIGVIRGHEGPVKCLASSPYNVGSGFLLYSGGLDKSLRVWWIPRNSTEDTFAVKSTDEKII